VAKDFNFCEGWPLPWTVIGKNKEDFSSKCPCGDDIVVEACFHRETKGLQEEVSSLGVKGQNHAGGVVK